MNTSLKLNTHQTRLQCMFHNKHQIFDDAKPKQAIKQNYVHKPIKTKPEISN